MIVWISSYPKSGNTWIRLFLTSYLNKNPNLSFKKIIGGDFPPVKLLKELNVDYKRFNNLSKNWISVQDYLNLNGKLNFLKTHNALVTNEGTPFTNSENTLATIYVVRDPRDVAVSYSHHTGKSQKEIIDMMFDRTNHEYITYPEKFIRSVICTWSDHYNSWKMFIKDRKIFIVKYEDLINNTYETFKKIAIYLKETCLIDYDQIKLKKSVEETNFLKIKKLEKDIGFNESFNKKVPFFREGKIGSWKNELDKDLEVKIRNSFKKEMMELGYI